MSKTVLITGASRGIGRAAALLFGAEGFRVAVNYHSSRERALELVEQLTRSGVDAAAFCADVSHREEVEEMFQQIRRRFGPVQVLVNNAGIAQQKLFPNITPREWEQMFAVNVGGMFHCCQAAVGEMIAAKSGCIVNLSSIWGIQGASCEVHYSAAKAAVIGFTRALAQELGPSGIRVNCVAPGVIDSEMNAALPPQTLELLREEIPLGQIGSCREAAECILFLASDRASFVTGQVLSPNGGMVL